MTLIISGNEFKYQLESVVKLFITATLVDIYYDIKQKYFEDKKISEIAAYTGRAEGTVKSDLSRAKRKLKLILEEG